MCARMRKVRLLVLLGALLLKVSLSLGGIRGAHVWTKKKILINSKKRSQNTHNKRVGLYIPRDIFFLNITHEGRRRRRSSSVFFRGGFFHEFLVWARHTRFIGLPFVAKKGAFSISFVDTQQ